MFAWVDNSQAVKDGSEPCKCSDERSRLKSQTEHGNNVFVKGSKVQLSSDWFLPPRTQLQLCENDIAREIGTRAREQKSAAPPIPARQSAWSICLMVADSC